MNRFLIVVGILCILAGLGWHWLARIPFGRLPGDIHFVRDGFNFYFPIVTCIVISAVVSTLLWFLRR
jgi:formate hydrogenlyase subunit 3/multisubunit Na+/H+ antiporter MnhD subunit